MLKVLTLVGTRPELIKMCRVIAVFDQYTHHILVHTDQNYAYELNQVFFEQLDIRKPDYFLGANGGSVAENIADIIKRTDEVLAKEKPDAMLIYGDTNSCLGIMAAKRRKIPVFHMEAGNRCFDQRVPEELNRTVIDHLSDINLVLTEHARRYLIQEGVHAERIFKTGSHLPEVLDYYQSKIAHCDILTKLKLTPRKYFIVSAHREENVDTPENLQDLIETLKALYQNYQLPIIFSTHPRTRKRLIDNGINLESDGIVFANAFGFIDYIRLQKDAFCVLSDSGTLTEETALLDLASINIRTCHERPEGMDEGTVVMAGLKKASVLNAVKIITHERWQTTHRAKTVPDYAGGLVSIKILKIVLSYTDYINHKVWSKPVSTTFKVPEHNDV